jgi:hypothetical protein
MTQTSISIAKKITFTCEVVTNNLISISNSHTTYGNERRMELLDHKSLLETYSNVLKLAKESSVSISYQRGTKRKINALKAQYAIDMKEYNSLFDNLVKLWTAKLAKGIYAPTSDDVELKDIYEARNKCNPFKRHTSNPGQMMDIKNHLDELYSVLNQENSISKIYL